MAESAQERTAQLVETNQALRHEIVERQRAEKEIKEQEQEKEKLEQQFLRSQRIESIGALAGGIAHDLNNALVPVLMGSDILRESAWPELARQASISLSASAAGFRTCTNRERIANK